MSALAAAGADAPDDPRSGEVEPWTCPFCALHCDSLSVKQGATLELGGTDCSLARSALVRESAYVAAATARVDGASASCDEAIDVAARLLAQARQAVFGGFATDVAGARALLRLADASRAIVDHAHGAAAMQVVRELQDRGTYSTTLAEVRMRADVIVCVGCAPTERYPEFFRRCGVVGAEAASFERRLFFLGSPVDPALAGVPNLVTEAIASADVLSAIATMNALALGRPLADPAGAAMLARVVDALRAARYGVVVWEPSRLRPHGELLAEAIARLVNTLNVNTRAASLALGGNDGAATANQVMTWLSGLPLRTGFHERGLEHDPHRYGAERLLASARVDLLLWVASIDPGMAPPDTDVPTIVLGHRHLAEAAERGRWRVFVPVSTPGIGSAGHLFRFDGGIALPLTTVVADGLPTVAAIAAAIETRLQQHKHRQQTGGA